MRKEIVLLSILLIFVMSCSSLQNPFESTPTPSSDTSDTESQSPLPQEANNYFDFNDILIPSELKLDHEESIIFESSRLKAGKLQFHGRVDPVSMFNFFCDHLPKDNWSIKGQFKYGQYLIIAEKTNKFCILKIDESNFSTTLKLWVTPRLP